MSNAPLETSHVRAVSDPALRKIKDEISFFALHGVTTSGLTRALLDALKAYETNANRSNGEYSAYDLARDAAEACKLAMMGGNGLRAGVDERRGVERTVRTLGGCGRRVDRVRGERSWG